MDAKGTVFLFAYDELGRLVQRTDDDGGANEGDTTLVYDLAAYASLGR